MSSSISINSRMQSLRVPKASKAVARGPTRVRASPVEDSSAPAPANAEPVQPVQPKVAPVAASSPASIGDVMAFNGTAPEITNGRLAMLGFVSAVGAELATGQGVFSQWAQEPTLINMTFILFASASLIPLLSSKKTSSQQIGPFTPSAELLNGRAAMIGFAALLAVEFSKGSALF